MENQITIQNCLNCEKEITDRFCPSCGQKSDTHRITLKNFILHDVLHGTFHVEKGMFFTAKQSLTRPGKAALDYISGKRKRYYNVFYLILITAGLMLFFWHFYGELVISQGREFGQDSATVKKVGKTIEVFSQKSKVSIFLFIPFAAINSFFLFRRKKLNLTEHSIIAGMVLLGILLLSTLGNILFYFDLIIEFSDRFANGISLTIVGLCILHIGHGYYNAFGDDYSRLGIAYRIILFFALLFLEILISLFIKIGLATNWKFGTFSMSLFG